MKGIDVSHWQGKIDWKKVKNDGYEFAIIKCTENTGFLDDKFEENKREARKAGLLLGFYHFAKGSNYIKEADWFLKNVGALQKGEFLVLDFEINSLNDPASWCKNWLMHVENKVGFKPMLYTYHAHLIKYDWRKVSDENFGLWAARYGEQTQEPKMNYRPSTGSWKFYAIWQYTSKGKVDGITGNVDLNYTDMTIEALKKYGYKGDVVTCPHCGKTFNF